MVPAVWENKPYSKTWKQAVLCTLTGHAVLEALFRNFFWVQNKQCCDFLWLKFDCIRLYPNHNSLKHLNHGFKSWFACELQNVSIAETIDWTSIIDTYELNIKCTALTGKSVWNCTFQFPSSRFVLKNY